MRGCWLGSRGGATKWRLRRSPVKLGFPPSRVAPGLRAISVRVLAELERLLGSEVRLPERSPFGDGRAAVRIVDIVASRLEL